MKDLFKNIALVAVMLVGFAGVAFGASTIFPYQGGTGTGVAPAEGEVLVGQSDGTYSPQATSTLGISGGAGGLFTDGGTEVFPTSGDGVSAPYILATSSTATSTFSGELVNKTKSLTNYINFWNGTFLEQFNASTTSDGTNASTTLLGVSSEDMTMRFSTGDSTLDCPADCSVAVTVGTDSSPQANYTYILESTGAITNSTTGWPAGEHIKVNFSFLPSASFIQTYGAYIEQNWNDGASNGNSTGHITHITQWIREQGATWFSGTAGEGSDGYVDLKVAGSEAYIRVGVGLISQVHQQTFSAVDTSNAGDTIHVVNHPTTAYLEISDLLDVMVDSTGASMSGKYYNIVIGGIANKTGTHSPIMMNLPSGSYNNEANALNDVDGYDSYAMPREFGKESSTGFYLARITLKNAGGSGGTLSVSGETDLRGIKQIQSVSGAGAGGSVTDFSDSQFTIFNNTDPTKIGVFDVSGVTTGNTRTVTYQDSDGTMPLLEATQTWTADNIFTNASSSQLTVSGQSWFTGTSTYPADVFTEYGGEIFGYSSNHGGLYTNSTLLTAEGAFEVYANTGADGGGTWSPNLAFEVGGNATFEAAGGPSNKIVFHGGEYVSFSSVGQNTRAVQLTTDNLTTNRAITFADLAGQYTPSNGTLASNVWLTTDGSGYISATTSPFDTFLRNTGGIGTGLYDFGGATSLEIPNNGTVNANGEVTTDDTSGQFRYYAGSAERVIAPDIDTAFLYATSTLGTGTTTLKVSGFYRATTFAKIGCVGNGSGTFVAQLGDGTASTTAVVSATGNTTTFTTVSSNNAFTSGEAMYWAIGSVSGTVADPSCSYNRSIDAD